jgi:hypothetical protein
MNTPLLDQIRKEIGIWDPGSVDVTGSPTPKLAKLVRLGLPWDCADWLLSRMLGGQEPTTYVYKIIADWVYLDYRKMKVDLRKVKRVREARKQWIEWTVGEHLPTHEFMTQVTANQVRPDISLVLFRNPLVVDRITSVLKADKDRVIIAIDIALEIRDLIAYDVDWYGKYTNPRGSEYTQLILIE